MKKSILSLLVVTMVGSTYQSAHADNFWGRLIGGLVGGALCDAMELGKGNGRTAAVILCAVGGSLLGAEVQKQMNESDARAYEEAQQRSFEGEMGRNYDWDGRRYGSRSGVRGRLRPIHAGYNRHTMETCRTYYSESYYNNRRHSTESIVCRRSDGSFYSLDRREDYVNGRLVESETYERQGQVGRPGHAVPPPAPILNSNRPAPYPTAQYGCSGWNMGNSLQVGDQVWTRSGEYVSYRGYNSFNNSALVLTQFNRQIILPLADIGIRGCHYGFKTGDVITAGTIRGTLLAIFQTGDLLVDSRGRKIVVPSYQVLR